MQQEIALQVRKLDLGNDESFRQTPLSDSRDTLNYAKHCRPIADSHDHPSVKVCFESLAVAN